MQMRVQCQFCTIHNIQRYTGVKSYLQVLQTGLRLIYNVSVGVIYNRPIQGHWTGLDILYKISQYPMLYKGEVLYTGLKDWTSVYLQFFIEILCTKGWISVFPPFLCISRQNGSSGDGAVFVIVISVEPKWNYVIFTFWFVVYLIIASDAHRLKAPWRCLKAFWRHLKAPSQPKVPQNLFFLRHLPGTFPFSRCLKVPGGVFKAPWGTLEIKVPYRLKAFEFKLEHILGTLSQGT